MTQIKEIYLHMHMKGATRKRSVFMFRLASLLFSIIGTTLAGSAIVVALTMGQDTLVPVVTAAVIGFAAALPVTWIVARKIAAQG